MDFKFIVILIWYMYNVKDIFGISLDILDNCLVKALLLGVSTVVITLLLWALKRPSDLSLGPAVL